MKILTLLLVLGCAADVCAQETNPLAWSHTAAAARASDALLTFQIAAETWSAWKAPNRKQALGCEALRLGITVGVNQATKMLVHRTRPDGSDRQSFYSGHAAEAFVSTGWRLQVAVPIAIGVGYLRTGANKHFASDVITGAVAGELARRVCKDGR